MEYYLQVSRKFIQMRDSQYNLRGTILFEKEKIQTDVLKS